MSFRKSKSCTRHYSEVLSPGSRVLDLASSWVSHLPEQEELELKSVVGLGMNEYELKHNKRLSRDEMSWESPPVNHYVLTKTVLIAVDNLLSLNFIMKFESPCL